MTTDPYAAAAVSAIVAFAAVALGIAITETIRGRDRAARDVFEWAWFALVGLVIEAGRLAREDYRRLVEGRRRIRGERTVVERIRDYSA